MIQGGLGVGVGGSLVALIAQIYKRKTAGNVIDFHHAAVCMGLVGMATLQLCLLKQEKMKLKQAAQCGFSWQQEEKATCKIEKAKKILIPVALTMLATGLIAMAVKTFEEWQSSPKKDERPASFKCSVAHHGPKCNVHIRDLTPNVKKK